MTTAPHVPMADVGEMYLAHATVLDDLVRIMTEHTTLEKAVLPVAEKSG
jgi:hypothetical protein